MRESQRLLRRARRGSYLAGVCAGLGNFYGINPWWFRLGFLIALIPGGIPGLGAYLLAWIIIPKE